MTRPVSRGLLGTDRAAAARLRPVAADAFVENAMKTLLGTDTYQMKERRDLLRRYLRGDADFFGRRVVTDAGRANAQYLLRMTNQRLRGIAFNATQITHVQKALGRLYEALG